MASVTTYGTLLSMSLIAFTLWLFDIKKMLGEKRYGSKPEPPPHPCWSKLIIDRSPKAKILELRITVTFWFIFSGFVRLQRASAGTVRVRCNNSMSVPFHTINESFVISWTWEPFYLLALVSSLELISYDQGLRQRTGTNDHRMVTEPLFVFIEVSHGVQVGSFYSW